MLHLTRIRACHRPTHNHQEQLYTRTHSHNNHRRPITRPDILLQPRGGVRNTALVFGVVSEEGDLAEGFDVVLFTGGEEDDPEDREDGNEDGGDPPEDREVLGEGVFLDEDCEHAWYSQKDVHAC